MTQRRSAIPAMSTDVVNTQPRWPRKSMHQHPIFQMGNLVTPESPSFAIAIRSSCKLSENESPDLFRSPAETLETPPAHSGCGGGGVDFNSGAVFPERGEKA